jgi:hypothetical protein
LRQERPKRLMAMAVARAVNWITCSGDPYVQSDQKLKSAGEDQMADNALLTSIGDMIGAVGGLGTAAFGLVDAFKAVGGGVSNAGFASIRKALAPLGAALGPLGGADPWDTLRANWINGMAKPDQKAIAKSLIRLGLTVTNAPVLATTTGIDATALTTAVTKVRSGNALDQHDLNILGEFDTIVSACLDAGYEKADQQYRNTAKLYAMIVSIILAIIGGGIIYYSNPGHDGPLDYLLSSNFLLALLLGVVATPLAPVTKDLSSALATAVKAVGSARR